MPTVKAAIINALSGFPVEFDELTVAVIEQRVSESGPENPAGFAYVTARNWAIDAVRRKAVQAKRKAAELLKAERERQERERIARLRLEFDDIVCELLLRGVFSTQERQLAIVRLACFDGKSDNEYAESFPGTNGNRRYQWRCRGVKMVARYGSEELREFLNERKWQR